MQQQTLQMVQAKPEDGHRTVSVCFDLHVHLCREELPGHTGPDKRHTNHRQEVGEAGEAFAKEWFGITSKGTLQTPFGRRSIDIYDAATGIAREVKVGAIRLSGPRIKRN